MNKLISIFVFTLFLVGCNKFKDESLCHDDNLLGTLIFTDAERSIIPYDGFNTIVFRNVSNYDDILPIYSGRKYSPFMVFVENGYPYTQKCKGNYYECELNDINFINDSSLVQSNGFVFFFALSISDPFTNPQIRKYFQVAISQWYRHPGVYPDSVVDRYEGQFWITGDSIYSNPDTSNLYRGTVSAYYSELTLGTKAFYRVYELQGAEFKPPISNFITIVYYTISDGIVGFRYNTGEAYFVSTKILYSKKQAID